MKKTDLHAKSVALFFLFGEKVADWWLKRRWGRHDGHREARCCVAGNDVGASVHQVVLESLRGFRLYGQQATVTPLNLLTNAEVHIVAVDDGRRRGRRRRFRASSGRRSGRGGTGARAGGGTSRGRRRRSLGGRSWRWFSLSWPQLPLTRVHLYRCLVGRPLLDIVSLDARCAGCTGRRRLRLRCCFTGI